MQLYSTHASVPGLFHSHNTDEAPATLQLVHFHYYVSRCKNTPQNRIQLGAVVNSAPMIILIHAFFRIYVRFCWVHNLSLVAWVSQRCQSGCIRAGG